MSIKPSVITTVERIGYELNKIFYLVNPDVIAKAIDLAIETEFATFENHLGERAQLYYDGEIFKARDLSLGVKKYFHLPQEYANLTKAPTLQGYLNIDPDAYSVYNKAVPKHRSVTPSSIYELLLDIDIYFDIRKDVSYAKIKELLTNNTTVIKQADLQHGILRTKDLITFQVDNFTYPAITITKTGVRPRRKFTRYLINKNLIKALLDN